MNKRSERQNFVRRHLFPFLSWRNDISPRTLRSDLVAGFTGAVVVLPQGVAFATIAGLPPEYGLYTAMVPAIIAALYGSSYHLVTGPTTAASIVFFSSLSLFAEPGTAQYISLALTLTLMVGAIQLILGIVRLGALVNFISHSVIVGFTAGAAILIGTSQLRNFFGVEIPRGGHISDKLLYFVRHLPDINWYVALVGGMTLIAGILVKRFAPRLPHLIIAILTGGVAAFVLNRIFGPEATAIANVGALPRTLPPLSKPEVTLSIIRSLAPTALAITLFTLAEAASIGRSLATKTGQRVDGNQEFIGQGLANIAGSFFSAFVATGSFNRSGTNYQAGAKTPLAAVFAGLFLVGIVLLVAPTASYLPNAAMGGILFLVAWSLIDARAIRHIFVSSRRETAVMLTTFLGALFLELEFAIFAGIILSLVLYLERTSHPHIVSRVPDPESPKRRFSGEPGLPECPQAKFLRIDGSIFFGSVEFVEEYFANIREKNPGQKHLAIFSQAINFVDTSGGDALAKETEERRKLGGDLYMISVKHGLRKSLERSGCRDVIGAENFFHSKSAAVGKIFGDLDRDVCKHCTTRIFRECGDAPKD
jgi:SulP family sulfate permease